MTDHETKAQKLAERMSRSAGDQNSIVDGVLLYARAIVKAEEALLYLTAEPSYSEAIVRHWSHTSGVECPRCLLASALSDLRALMGEEG